MHPNLEPMQPRRARAGFTLIELMVVVAIVGLGTALSAAGVADAISENRANRAARELVRVGRRARSDAMGYMRAYMLWAEPAQNRITLLRSWASNCANENWNNRLTVAASGGLGCGALGTAIPQASACVEQVRFTDPAFSNDAYASRIDLDVVGAPVATNVAICYNPNGLMFTDQPANLAAVALTSDNVNAGALRFWVRRMSAGVQQGVQRFVLFPQGAPPRVER